MQWLGTAGFRIEHRGHVVLIDPYLTRASLAQCILGPVSPDEQVLARETAAADAILVGHTHFDHALDVPAIARRTGARVFGSWSAASLCLSHGVAPGRVHIVESEGSSVQSGPFRIRFVPSHHSAFLAGHAPFPGELAASDARPMRVEQYRSGAVFIIELEVDGRCLVHLGSAAVPQHGQHRHAALVLLCAAGWRSSPALPERLIERYTPDTVLLSHWDDFFRPLSLPARAIPGIGLEALARRIRNHSAQTRVGTVPLLGTLSI